MGILILKLSMTARGGVIMRNLALTIKSAHRE